MSFNTLTPHYEEDVIFALAAADTARQLGLAGPDAHEASVLKRSASSVMGTALDPSCAAQATIVC